jgi:8-oxo-dGTP pyrophosphatase MutT (NUDIX family)
VRGGGVVKEATASVYVFRRSGAGEWLLGLMLHPRFGEWLTPGGHVEADESPAEAAVRETAEELGCEVRLLPGPSMPLPAGYPHMEDGVVRLSADQHVTAARHGELRSERSRSRSRFPVMKAATSQTVDLMSKVESDGMLS